MSYPPSCTCPLPTHQARALFKGMATPLLGVAAINAILFGINGRLMKKFQEQAGKEPLKLRYSFISGAVAGSVQVFICSPMELIKLRLQLQTEKMELFHHSSDGRLYRSPWDAAKKIYQKDGIFRGLGKGFWTTMLREVPSFAFYFGSYDFLCRSAVRYQGHSHVNEINPAVICMAGGIGGIMAWVVSYPVDVMKSRLQVDGMEGPRRYRGMLDCFRQSSREGMGVFVRGLQPTLIRAFPTNAVTFVTVSLILRAWRKPDSDS